MTTAFNLENRFRNSDRGISSRHP